MLHDERAALVAEIEAVALVVVLGEMVEIVADSVADSDEILGEAATKNSFALENIPDESWGYFYGFDVVYKYVSWRIIVFWDCVLRFVVAGEDDFTQGWAGDSASF